MDDGTSGEPVKKRSRIDGVPHTLNLMQILPLKDVAMTQVVTCLWQLPSLNAVYDFYKGVEHELWSPDENADCRRFLSSFKAAKLQVQERLSLLELPENLKSEASFIVEPVGFQILHWLNSEMCVAASPKFVDSICWTSLGTVHGVNTLEKLLAKHNPGTIVDQFRAAAHCFAENLVLDLWHKLPEETKCDLASRRTFDYHDDHLLAYWVFFCNGHLDELLPIILSEDEDLKLYDRNHSLDRNMCKLAATTDNLSGIEYFWAKLSDEEREDDVELLIMAAENYRRHFRMRIRKYRTAVFRLPLLDDSKFLQRYFHEMFSNTPSRVATICFFLSNVIHAQQLVKFLEGYSYFVMRYLCRMWPFYRFVEPLVLFAGHRFHGLTYSILTEGLRQFIPPDIADEILYHLWGYFPDTIKETLIECAVRLSIYENESTRIRDARYKPKSISQLINGLKEGRMQTGLGLGISSEADYNELVEYGHPKLISVIETEELYSFVRARDDLIRPYIETRQSFRLQNFRT